MCQQVLIRSSLDAGTDFPWRRCLLWQMNQIVRLWARRATFVAPRKIRGTHPKPGTEADARPTDIAQPQRSYLTKEGAASVAEFLNMASFG